MSFGGLLGFLTRLPGAAEDLEETARSAWLFPLVGLVIGLALYGLALPVALFLPPDVGAALLLVGLYLLTGILHLDGLADFGDALALPGSPEDRLRAMKDVRVGVGGVLSVLLVLLLEWSALRFLLTRSAWEPLLLGALPFGGLAATLVLSEVAAKLSMSVALVRGSPEGRGMGALFARSFRPRHVALATVLALATGLLLRGPLGLLVLVGAAAGALAAALAQRTVGGANGDVLGASNEWGRTGALLAWTVVAWT